MRHWLNFKDLFSFQPPSTTGPSILTETYKELMFEGQTSVQKAQLENIRFDNSMRIIISILALLASFGLWLGHVIPRVSPVVGVFVFYAGLQFLGMWLVTKVRQPRLVNFAICAIDMIGLSLAVLWTGNTASPLYFIYFMPLIIQAFHRDWALLVYYGVVGLTLYTAVVLVSVPHWTSTVFLDLGARIVFMGISMSIALLAVNLLRKQEAVETRRMSRLKCLTYVSQVLNGTHILKDLPTAVEEFVKVLNMELKDPMAAYCRIFLVQDGNPMMQVVQDPSLPRPELKQTIAVHACPVVHGNTPFQIKDSDVDTGCPTESFAFRSHICIPVSGANNESYGVIFSGSGVADAFKEEDVQFLQFIGKSLGLAIQRLKRIEELRLAFEMDSCAMATFMGSTRTMKDTFDAILDGMKSLLEADQVTLYLWDQVSSKVVTAAVQGEYAEKEWNQAFHMGEGIPGRVLESAKPYWTYSLESTPTSPFKGILCVPLHTVKGEPLGVVSAAILDHNRMYSIEEIDLASTFATRASLAIENALLHQQERKASNNPTIIRPDEKAA